MYTVLERNYFIDEHSFQTRVDQTDVDPNVDIELQAGSLHLELTYKEVGELIKVLQQAKKDMKNNG